MIVYVIEEIVGSENSPDSLNVMVNYHYHSENRVITNYGAKHMGSWLSLQGNTVTSTVLAAT